MLLDFNFNRRYYKLEGVRKMEYIKPITFWLTIVGALNWGIIALLNLNLVTIFFPAGSMITTIIYVLIGLSALYLAFNSQAKKGKK
ncbi:MAG: DUF378 domain-containing protein [Candidatus Daviesbacteria bacterium]|nr:DUF378 domain-containing protein [Candidatus Daviesbacteria bacterium]